MSDTEENVITNFNFYSDASMHTDEETNETTKVTIGQVLVQISDEEGGHMVRPNVFDVTNDPRDVGFLTVSLALFTESWTAELFGIYLAIHKVFKNDKLRTNRFAVYTICSDCQPSIFAAQCLAVECQRRFEKRIPSTGFIADNFLYLFGAYKNSKASGYQVMTKDANFITVLRALEMLYNAILRSNETKGRYGYDFSFAYVPAHFEDKRKRDRTPICDMDFSKCNILMKETALDIFYLMYADEIADIYPGYKTRIPMSIYSFMRQGVSNVMEKKLESLFFERATLNRIKDAMSKLKTKKGNTEGKPAFVGEAEVNGDATITVCDIEKRISSVLENWTYADIPFSIIDEETVSVVFNELIKQEKDRSRVISQISKRTKGVVRKTWGRKKISDIPAKSARASLLRNRPFFSHRKVKLVHRKPKVKVQFSERVIVSVKTVRTGVLEENDPDNIFYNEPEYRNDIVTKMVTVEREVDNMNAPDIIEKVPEPISPEDEARELEADIELEDNEESKDYDSYILSFVESVKGDIKAANEWWNRIFGSRGSFNSNVVYDETSVNTLTNVSFMRYISLPTL